MFVDNFGMSRVVVVVVVSGNEERFEVCHEKESDGVLLFLVGDVLVKFRHDVFAAVYVRVVGCIRWEGCDIGRVA